MRIRLAAADASDQNPDLPTFGKSHLLEHPQEIFRATFNHAFESHHDDPRQKEIAETNLGDV